jgi:hypothetical protein
MSIELYKISTLIETYSINDITSFLRYDIYNKKDLSWFFNPYINENIYYGVLDNLNDYEYNLFIKNSKNVIVDYPILNKNDCERVIYDMEEYDIQEENIRLDEEMMNEDYEEDINFDILYLKGNEKKKVEKNISTFDY